MKVKKEKAFTLAEVLVTLTIIGVIASITIPVLMQNWKKQAFEAQYLKSKSILSNGINLLMVKSAATHLIYSPLIDCYNNSENQALCLQSVSKKMFNIIDDSIINPNLLNKLKDITYKISYIPSYSDFLVTPAWAANSLWNNVSYAFVTSGGFMFGYEKDTKKSDNEIIGLYMVSDVNGAKKPNTMGVDFRRFEIDDNGKLTDITEELKQEENSQNTGNSGSSSGSGSSGGSSSGSSNTGGGVPEPTHDNPNISMTVSYDSSDLDEASLALLEAVSEADNGGNCLEAFPQEVQDSLPENYNFWMDVVSVNFENAESVEEGNPVTIEIPTETNFNGRDVFIIVYDGYKDEYNVIEAQGNEAGNVVFTTDFPRSGAYFIFTDTE